MDIFTREDLRTLIEARAEVCVSIFLPTHRAGADKQQDPIRLKNLLGKAEERLLAHGLRAAEVNECLGPARAILNDRSFWQHQQDGLAVFLTASPETFRHYSIPIRFTELVIVAERFHVKPLLPLLSGDGQFYVLALSQNEVRLLQGTRHTVAEVALEGVPRSLAEALQYDDPERQLQFRTVATGRDQAAAAFHGHGAGGEEEQARLRRYFQKVDSGLRKVLAEEQLPLVLAGVEYLLPLYRQANSYGHLTEEGITGNVETLSPEALHTRAWKIVAPIFQRAQHAAIEKYKTLLGSGQAANRLADVIPAAHYGRVECLFVPVGRQEWGSFDPETGKLEVHKEAQPGDVDLFDLAAIQTILNRGVVYAVQPAEMPASSGIAAIFRY